VQAAEGLIFLIYGPGLAVELDFDDVVGVGAVVCLILDHACADDLQSEWNLEKETAMPRVVFGACLHVVDEDLSWEKDVAELALHGDGVLEDPLVNLDRVNFLRKLAVALLNVRDSF
jgi:hypothetical protein